MEYCADWHSGIQRAFRWEWWALTLDLIDELLIETLNMDLLSCNPGRSMLGVVYDNIIVFVPSWKRVKIAVPILIVITPYHESNERPIERLCFNPRRGRLSSWLLSSQSWIVHFKGGEINISCDESLCVLWRFGFHHAPSLFPALSPSMERVKRVGWYEQKGSTYLDGWSKLASQVRESWGPFVSSLKLLRTWLR